MKNHIISHKVEDLQEFAIFNLTKLFFLSYTFAVGTLRPDLACGRNADVKRRNCWLDHIALELAPRSCT
jgi:hypothetical protein